MPRTVVVQGARGGYSEQAALEHFDEELDVRTEPSFADVVRALREDRVGVLPIENTMVGTFAPVADLFMEYQPWIVAEVQIPVPATLVVHPGTDIGDLDRILAYPELLERSRGFVERHELETLAATDTAGAVAELKDHHGPETGALAPPRAADLHGMEVLQDDVQDHKNAVGRLFVITRYEQEVPDDADKTSIGFVVPDKPGALHDALGVFADRGINLVRLDCRPVSERAWHYAFHADLEGSTRDPTVEEALQALGRRALEVRVFGSYKAAER